MENMMARDAWFDDPDFNGCGLAATFLEAPFGFVDVGVRGGVHGLVEPVARAASVLAFDPDPEACAELADAGAGWGGYEIVPAGLAETSGRRTLHLLSAATNHSLLPPNEHFTSRYRMVKHLPMGEMEVPTISLDEAIFSRDADQSNQGEFIKLDTQGTEYEILRGARRTLTERTVALLVEVEFCEIYKDQKLFSDIDLFLREFGFSFYSFTKYYYRSRKVFDKRRTFGRERLMCADAVFLKDPLPGGPAGGPANISPRRARALTLSALLLGYYDYARELALETWASDPTTAAQIDAFTRRLAARPSERTAAEVAELAQAVAERPEDANLLAVRFADAYRTVCDMDDVVS